MNQKPIGRPMKYAAHLLALEDETLYSPTVIVTVAEEKGLLQSDPEDAKARKAERLRIRHSVLRFAVNHLFPEKGDGFVYLPGLPPARGWYGWRWKKQVLQKCENATSESSALASRA